MADCTATKNDMAAEYYWMQDAQVILSNEGFTAYRTRRVYVELSEAFGGAGWTIAVYIFETKYRGVPANQDV